LTLGAAKLKHSKIFPILVVYNDNESTLVLSYSSDYHIMCYMYKQLTLFLTDAKSQSFKHLKLVSL